MPKCKRYNGRESNVDLNLFFEDYMNSVAESNFIEINSQHNFQHLAKKKNLAYLPTGFVSRSKASREFGLKREV